MTIIIDVIDQQIAVKGHKVPLAPHSENFIKLTFLLSSEWKNFKTFAQFRQSNNPPVNVYLDESNSVYVPREIKAGNFTVMLYGAGESIIGTTNCLIFNMVDNCFSADAIETDLTPTLYQQLLNEFKSYLASTKVNLESATSSADGLMSAADKSKLDGIGAGSNVKSVNGKTGVVNLSKADVGLGNVDNTKDADKPVSTAVQTALDSKADKTTATSSADGLMSKSDKAKLDGIEAGSNVKSVNGKTGAVTLAKGDVGLGSVANLDQSKAIKSITRSGTTFTATALDGTTSTFTQQDSSTTYSVATSSTDGLMSAADKTKLDGISSSAGSNVVATESTDGLMSAADKTKLDGITSTYATKSELSSHSQNTSNPHKVTASQVGALPLSGGSLTGNLTAPSFQTGTGNANYFQSRKFRGEGDANNYYHAVDFGYAGHNQVDFYEYGGKYVFHRYQGNDSVIGEINSNGFVGKVNGHTINADVPVGAKFTDTTYSNATTSVAGLMSPADKAKLDGISSGSLKSDLANKLYPVGSIYMSVNATNPAELFGGTWEQIKDRFLLAAGDTYANGSTGSVTTGDSQPHNNMPPYLTVYMWKRVS